jgi:hypothetical protein
MCRAKLLKLTAVQKQIKMRTKSELLAEMREFSPRVLEEEFAYENEGHGKHVEGFRFTPRWAWRTRAKVQAHGSVSITIKKYAAKEECCLRGECQRARLYKDSVSELLSIGTSSGL